MHRTAAGINSTLAGFLPPASNATARSNPVLAPPAEDRRCATAEERKGAETKQRCTGDQHRFTADPVGQPGSDRKQHQKDDHHTGVQAQGGGLAEMVNVLRWRRRRRRRRNSQRCCRCSRPSLSEPGADSDRRSLEQVLLTSIRLHRSRSRAGAERRLGRRGLQTEKKSATPIAPIAPRSRCERAGHRCLAQQHPATDPHSPRWQTRHVCDRCSFRQENDRTGVFTSNGDTLNEAQQHDDDWRRNPDLTVGGTVPSAQWGSPWLSPTAAVLCAVRHDRHASNSNPPKGRTRNPAAKAPKAPMSDAVGLDEGKNSRPITVAKYPYTAKSYHSMTLPISPAKMRVVLRGVEGVIVWRIRE